MQKFFKKYLDNNIKLHPYQRLGIIFLIVAISGFFGWLYEFIFYFFNSGMTEWYMQGGNFLPWINIYAIGSLLIILSTFKIRKHPLAIFFISVFITGILELIAGWLVYIIGNGTRYWDYNTEILNFGNINGFVCLRSVLFFGVSALMLMYIILPFCIYLSQIMPRRTFLILSIIIFSAIMADELYNLIAKVFNLYNAIDFYKSLGLKYMNL